MDVTCRLDQVLQVRPEQEVSKRNKIAMILVLDVYHAPSILTPSHDLAVDVDVAFRADNCERRQVFHVSVNLELFFIVFACILALVVWEHAQVVEGKLVLDALFKCLTLFESHRVRFGNHRHDVHHVAELLEDDDVDRFEPT